MDAAHEHFELLSDRELRQRGLGERISGASFVARELAQFNGANVDPDLGTLSLHPAAAEEMLEVRTQRLASLREGSTRRRFVGHDIEGMLAWALAQTRESAERWPYREPHVFWRLVWGPASPYAVVFAEHGGVHVLGWRRHELFLCVDPDAFASRLVLEGSTRATRSASAIPECMRAPLGSLEEAGASEVGQRIAAVCRGGRGGVLADARKALGVSVELRNIGALLEGVEAASVWRHPANELAPLDLFTVAREVAACIHETVILRELYSRGPVVDP